MIGGGGRVWTIGIKVERYILYNVRGLLRFVVEFNFVMLKPQCLICIKFVPSFPVLEIQDISMIPFKEKA